MERAVSRVGDWGWGGRVGSRAGHRTLGEGADG